MPYKTRKVPKKNCYRVYNAKTKRVFARCASKKNAAKQLRLLRALQFNKEFVPLGRQRTLKKRE
jgi:hypothetical protein